MPCFEGGVCRVWCRECNAITYVHTISYVGTYVSTYVRIYIRKSSFTACHASLHCPSLLAPQHQHQQEVAELRQAHNRELEELRSSLAELQVRTMYWCVACVACTHHTLYTTHCTPHTVRSTHCTPHTVHHTLYTTHCTPHTVRMTLCSTRCTVFCILHATLGM